MEVTVHATSTFEAETPRALFETTLDELHGDKHMPYQSMETDSY